MGQVGMFTYLSPNKWRPHTFKRVKERRTFSVCFQAESCAIYKPEISYAGLEAQFVSSAPVSQSSLGRFIHLNQTYKRLSENAKCCMY